MIKKNLKRMLISTGMGALLISLTSPIITHYANQTSDIDTNTNKENSVQTSEDQLPLNSQGVQTFEYKVGRDESRIRHFKDNKVLHHTQLHGVFLAGNGDVEENVDVLKRENESSSYILNASLYAAAIGWNKNVNGWTYYHGPYWHAANDTSIPEWAAYIDYQQLDFFDSNTTGTDSISKSQLKQVGTRLHFDTKSKNGELVNSNKRMGGVIKIGMPWWQPSTLTVPGGYGVNTPYAMYGFIGDTSAHSVLGHKKNYGFLSINNYEDKNANPHFNGHYTYQHNGWERYGMAFAALDEHLWFTTQESSIQNIDIILSGMISLERFRKIASNYDTLMKSLYLDVMNTPKAVIQNSATKDSVVSVTFDDNQKKVILNFTIPRKYKPNYQLLQGSIAHTNWIVDEPMTLTKEISYSAFIDAKTKMNNYNDLGMNDRYLSSVQETDIKNAIIAKNLVKGLAPNKSLTIDDIVFTNQEYVHNVGQFKANVTIRNNKATTDGYDPVESLDLGFITFGGFKRSGKMDNSVIAGLDYASHNLKDTNAPTNEQDLQVYNEIWQANLISNNDYHMLVPTKKGLAFINRFNAKPEFYADQTAPNTQYHENLTKYLIQTHYDKHTNTFLCLTTSRDYNQVHMFVINAKNGSIITKKTIINNLESVNNNFSGKGKYFAFTPSFSSTKFNDVSVTVFPRFKIENQYLGRLDSAADKLLARQYSAKFTKDAANNPQLLQDYNNPINISSFYKTQDENVILSFPLLQFDNENNVSFPIIEKSENERIFYRVGGSSSGNFTEDNHWGINSQITANATYKDDFYFANGNEELLLKTSPIINWAPAQNFDVSGKTVLLKPSILNKNGSITQYEVTLPHFRYPEAAVVKKELAKPNTAISLNTVHESVNMHTNASMHNAYNIKTTITLPDNTIALGEVPVGEAFGTSSIDTNLGYDPQAFKKKYTQLAKTTLDSNDNLSPVHMDEKHVSEIVPRAGDDTPGWHELGSSNGYISSIDTSNNINELGEVKNNGEFTLADFGYENYKYSIKTWPFLDKVMNIDDYIGANYQKFFNWNENLFHPKRSVYFRYWVSPDRTYIKLAFTWLKDQDTGLKRYASFTIRGFVSPDQQGTYILDSTNLGLNNKTVLDVTNQEIIDAIINVGAVKHLAPNATLMPQDILIEGLSKNKLTGTIRANITIRNNKATDGTSAVDNKQIGPIVFTGFKPINRTFVPSTDGLNVYGFENDTNYLWALDTTQRDNDSDARWAYIVKTEWLLPQNAVIDIRTLKGYNAVKDKVVSEVLLQDYIDLVYASKERFWSILPPNFSAQNIDVRNISNHDHTNGAVDITVNTSYIINDRGEVEDVTDSSRYVGGTVRLTGFIGQKPTSWTDINTDIDVQDVTWSEPNVLSGLYVNFLKNTNGSYKELLVKQFIHDNLDKFFHNVPKSKISVKDILINPNNGINITSKDTLSVSFRLGKGFDANGSFAIIYENTLPFKTFNFQFFKPVTGVPTTITEVPPEQWSFRKDSITPSQLAQDKVKLKEMFAVGHKQVFNIFFPGTEIQTTKDDFLRDILGSFNCVNASGTSSVDPSLAVEAHPDKEGWIVIKQPIYVMIGDSVHMTVNVANEQDAVNDTKGSIKLEVTIPNAVRETNGILETFELKQTFTINGFLTTSSFVENSDNIGVGIELFNVDNETIIENIVYDTDIFHNTKPLAKEDIEITRRQDNNITGKTTVTIKIKNYKAKVDGTYVQEKEFHNVTFGGFIPVNKTEFQNHVVEIPVETKHQNLSAADLEKSSIYKYVLKNQDKIFKSKLPNWRIEDFDIWSTNIRAHEGRLGFMLGVNSYVDDNGLYHNKLQTPNIPTLNATHEIVLTGFQTDGLTTTSTQEIVDITRIDPHFANVLPEQIAEHPFDLAEIQKLKEAIAKDANSDNPIIIKNLAKELGVRKQLAAEDITIGAAEYDNVLGTAEIVVDIRNSKAWVDGQIVRSWASNRIRLSGFDKVDVTTFNPVNRIDANQLNHPTNQQDKLSTITAEQFVDNGNNNRFTLQALKHNISSFVSHLPNDFNADTDMEITSAIPDLKSGTVAINFTLKKYIDPNTGRVVTNGKLPSPTFTIFGFTTDGLDTIVNSYDININKNNILATSIVDDDARIKDNIREHLKQNLRNAPTNKDFSRLTNSDFSFTVKQNSANNSTGTLQVNIILKNGYGWRDGNVIDNFSFDQAFNLTGFMTQAETKLKDNASLPAGSFGNRPNNQFTVDNAQSLLNNQDNLNNLFLQNTLPNGVRPTVTTINPMNGTEVEVKFTLDKYFNSDGVLVNNTSPEYTIKVTGFSTQYTSLAKSTVALIEVHNIYAIEFNVNERFIKTNLIEALQRDRSIFANLDSSFKFNESSVNLVPGSLKNFWSADNPSNSLGEVKVKFTLTGSGVNTESGSQTTPEFEITLNGFKDTPHTTIINKQDIIVANNSPLKGKAPSALNEQNYQAIKKEILNNNIFSHTLPEAYAITEDDISINQLSEANDINGTVNVNATLSDKKAWIAGKPQAFNFNITLKGFSKPTSTTWVDTTVITDRNLANKYAQDWTQDQALNYVRDNISKFVVGGYASSNGFNRDDVSVQLYDVQGSGVTGDRAQGQRKIKITLARHNDENGPSTSLFYKEFFVKGFKPFDTSATELAPNANTKILENFNQIFGNKTSRFIADIFKDDRTKGIYEDNLKSWLSKPHPSGKQNASLIFSNYAINYQTSVESVRFELAGTDNKHEALNVNIMITLNGAQDDNGGEVNGKSFVIGANTGLTEKNRLFIPTPEVSISGEIRQIVQDLIERFNTGEISEEALKHEVIEETLKSIEDKIKRPYYLPTVIVEQFKKDELRTALQDLVSIKYNDENKIDFITIRFQSSPNEIIKGMKLKDIKVTAIASNISAKEDSKWNWIIWVIIGTVIGVAIIVVLLLVVYSKKDRRAVDFDY